MDRRNKRSDIAEEALQYLAEAVAHRSEVQAVAFIDEGGHMIAGTGSCQDLLGLRAITLPISRGEPCDRFDEVTAGTDFMLRAIVHERGTMYLAALGTRVRKMAETVGAVRRILSLSLAQA
jgi:hypothetical protein